MEIKVESPIEEKREKDHFKLREIINLNEFTELGKQLNTSDLTIQNENMLYQFEFVDVEQNDTKIILEPGIKTVIPTSSGIVVEDVKLNERNLLNDIVNVATIKDEATRFFNKQHVFLKRNRIPKRSILFASSPGLGKTCVIESFIQEAVKEDPNTLVLIWQTTIVESGTMLCFLQSGCHYDERVSRVILIMEDIGGGEMEAHNGPRGVDGALLQLLDGVGVVFPKPTFIIATTNFPENLVESLAARPGRFDKLIRLDPPNAIERVKLLTFFKGDELTQEEKDSISHKRCGSLSIAFLQEIVFRHELEDKSISEVVKDVIDYLKLYNNNFEEKRTNSLITMRNDD